MSYQFEDDSALEELLNQQLDRRTRQPPQVSAGRRIGSALVDNKQPANSARPATSQSMIINKPADIQDEAPKLGRLSSWLDGKKPSAEMNPSPSSSIVRIEQPSSLPTNKPSYSSSRPLEDDLDSFNDNDQILSSLTESQLKDMSKQSLIRLILTQVEPHLRQMKKKVSIQLKLIEEKEELQRQLKIEVEKLESLEAIHIERLKASELSWQQLNNHLKNRLESREAELKDASERQTALLSEIGEKHKQECLNLAESYRERLIEEKVQFEEILKRREEYHKLELESKLKVNCDLNQLETIFAEWNRLIQSTLSEFHSQFKQVESMLDKQTIQINSNTMGLTKRGQSLGEQYESFSEQTQKLSKVAEKMEFNLPKFLSVNETNQELVKKINDKLAEFIPLNDELRAQERELSRLKDELKCEKERVAQERFQLGLDSNRLAYREERLNELESLNEQTNLQLKQQMQSFEERESQLRLQKSQLDIKSEELKDQNYELHQNRKNILEKEDKVVKLERELKEEQDRLDREQTRVRNELRQVEGFRERAKKEMQQLKRLQNALVCSICLDRLFKGGGQMKSKSNNIEELKKGDFNLELVDFNQYIQADGKQLEEENKYVRLLSMGELVGPNKLI